MKRLNIKAILSVCVLIVLFIAGCVKVQQPRLESAGAAMPGLAAERQYEWTNVARIVAVGDVHGDYEKMVKCLKANGVIDDGNKWIGGKTHLVQTGDILSKGPDSKKAMDLLMSLEQQAKDAGGAVHALIGNNELKILWGDYKNLYRTEHEPYGGMEAFQQAMAADGKYGKWIRSHNAVIKINDILFLHGGISPRYAAMSLQTLNQGVTASFGHKVKKKKRKDRPPFYRGLAKGDENTVKAELEAAINNFGIRHIVIGHSRTRSQVIELKADGEVIMIDVGMSKTVRNGPAMSLLIENDKFYAVTPEEKKELPVKHKVSVNGMLQRYRLPHVRFALVGA